MHVLLTNDDGPPSDLASPYIKFLVDEITNNTDWDLSIVVPTQQRSWIGKAHFAGKDLSAQFIYSTYNKPLDNTFLGPFPTPVSKHQQDKTLKEWCIVDGTPASCTDIGVHHIYSGSKPPVDLVISGPNYGRNSSGVYIMASGTVGAAMEAALTGKKAIGLSYLFDTRTIDEPVLKKASELAVKVINYLYKNWDSKTDLYSINVPLKKSLLTGDTKIIYAPILENRWGSIFRKEINNRSNDSSDEIIDESVLNKEEVSYKWDPNFDSTHKWVAESTHVNDGRVVYEGNISVTPMKAIFQGVESITGEINLNEQQSSSIVLSIPESTYIYPALLQSLLKHLTNYKIYSSLEDAPKNSKIFHYGDYEDLDFDLIMEDDGNYLPCSYVYRKALIRKHFLAHVIHSYTTKNPTSILKKAFPLSYQLELDYAEFLDDSLDDCYELRDDVEQYANEKLWILKPSMSDKGQGIRIFSNLTQLQEIFNSFEEESEEEEEDEDVDRSAFGESGERNNDGNGVITSQLRHFLVQEYINNPLLLPEYGNRKFHIRSYVVCSGSLKVYLYEKMLMLFSKEKYVDPLVGVTDNDDEEILSLAGHLTNTCLQEEIKTDGVSNEDKTVVEFWSSELTNKKEIFDQLKEILKELFTAATSVDKFNFRPLNTGFEVFGIDFLIDSNYNATLLEVNSYPDFKQTGEDLKTVIYGLFNDVVGTCVKPFYGETSDSKSLHQVLDLQTDGW